MKGITTVLIVLLFVGYSQKTPDDMIEIVDGATRQQKLNLAAIIMRELVLEGYPDPSCTGPDADMVRCERLVNEDLLEIVVRSSKSKDRVYFQCVIHDESRHNELMVECLGRLREKLNDSTFVEMQSPDYHARVREYREMLEREEAVREEADWIGQTRLPEEVERQLPHYLRLEFGESLFDDDGLKAAELVYLGQHSQSDGSYHYWYVPSGDEDTWYAYVRDSDYLMGWGDREPSDAVSK